MLAIIKKYKNIYSILLMCLYIFIATPVSFWHQHHVATRSSKSLKTHTSIIAKHAVSSDQIDSDEVCSVCSHQFSPFIDDAFYYGPLMPSPRVSVEGVHINSYSGIPSPNKSNKGPPVCIV